MYNVLLADDERSILDGIVSYVPWEELDCRIVSQATNGILAKEYIDSGNIDIAVLDIQMPGITGLDLSKYIAEKSPRTSVIILTAYNDFSYIQNALRTKVVDYVIKTSYESELPNAVEKAISMVNFRLNQIRQLDVSTASGHDDHASNLLQRMLFNPTSESWMCGECIRIMPVLAGPFCVVIFQLLRMDNTALPFKSIQSESLKHILHDISSSGGHIFIMPNSTLLTLVNCRGGTADFLPRVEDCYASISNELEDSGSCKLQIGISSVKNGVSSLYSAYREAIDILLRFQGIGGIHRYVPDMKHEELCYEALAENTRKIMSSVDSGNFSSAKDFINEMLKYMDIEKLSLESIRYMGMLISSICFACLRMRNIDFQEDIEYKIVKAIHEAQSANLIYKQVSDLIELFSGLMLQGNVQYSAFTQKTLDFLNQNYSGKLTLGSIASHVHLNPSYLCRIFRNETGASIIDTLNMIRIKKAKELLKSRKYKVADVAYAVGISDPGYFTHVFSRYTGMSPTDYYNRTL